MEKCVQIHVFDFLKSNNLLASCQSGFIPGDSTVYQLLVMYDDLCKFLDSKITSQSVFFDISKAFDKVWHRGLIYKLHCIGIRGSLLNWFTDYLKGRYQAVVIKGKTSSYKPISAGVPQGSVLGPLLFLIYINDIVDDIDSAVKLFADDTSIYLGLDDSAERTRLLNSDLKKIINWSKKWKVVFNPAKTKLMTFSNRRQPDTLPLLFGQEILVETNMHKHLGVILQNNGRWENHIDSLISKTRILIACLRSYKYKFSRKSQKTIYTSFILPHLDYADVIWDNCTDRLSNELESLHLDALRTIVGAVRGTSHIKLYNESGFMSLTERRRRHKLIMYFKIASGLAPDYITQYLPPLVSSTNPYHRRNPLERKIPNFATTLYQDSFFISTTYLWNALPDNIKQLTSLSAFKRFISTNDVAVPPYYNVGERKPQTIHCKLRLNMSDLNNDLYNRHLSLNKNCDCSPVEEDANHFLLKCPRFTYEREVTINTLLPIAINIETLLFGNPCYSIAFNSYIFLQVHEFITLSSRFEGYLIVFKEYVPDKFDVWLTLLYDSMLPALCCILLFLASNCSFILQTTVVYLVITL